MKVLTIKTNNVIQVEDINELYEMQNIVGGRIEAVYPRAAYLENTLLRDNCFVCDEEGLLKDKPMNVIGTILYNGLNPEDYINPIVGDIFIVGYGDYDFRELNNDEIDFYIKIFNKIIGGILNGKNS